MESGEATAAVMFPVDGAFGPIRWMPDGVSLVAFGLGKVGIYRLDTLTGNASPIILDPTISSQDFALSPDGKMLYYSRRQVFIERDLATGREREIIRRPSLGSLNLSPDGKYIATPASEFSPNARVVLLIPTGGNEAVRELIRVPYGPAPEGMTQSQLNFEVSNRTLDFVSWSRDSRSVVLKKFSRDASKGDELWSVQLDGGETGKAAIPARTLDAGPAIAISPDQRHAAYTISEPFTPPITELSILENFLPRAAKK
jgi:Tol biopolymer transport system component